MHVECSDSAENTSNRNWSAISRLVASPFLKMGVIITPLEAVGVLPTDMKDSKMTDSGRANALDMFFIKVLGKPSWQQVLLFLVFLIAFKAAAGDVNITLSNASSITGGVQVGLQPSSLVPAEPIPLFRMVASSKTSASSLPLASMSGEIPLERLTFCWCSYKSLQRCICFNYV